jgi:hypothetical protein
MKVIILVLTLLAISGTARALNINDFQDSEIQTEAQYRASQYHPGRIDPEFIPYLERFMKEAGARGIQINPIRARALSIEFGFNLVADNTLGQCDVTTKQMKVSESYWATAGDMEKEVLIFHELGHCLLGREHEDNTMPISGGWTYKSVMNSYGNALMFRMATNEDCVNRGECGVPVFAPKSKKNFYTMYHKIYMDELFGVVAPNRIKLTFQKYVGQLLRLLPKGKAHRSASTHPQPSQRVAGSV